MKGRERERERERERVRERRMYHSRIASMNHRLCYHRNKSRSDVLVGDCTRKELAHLQSTHNQKHNQRHFKQYGVRIKSDQRYVKVYFGELGIL